MLSLLYALFFLAAGSDASPCKPKSGSGSASVGTKSSAQKASDGNNNVLALPSPANSTWHGGSGAGLPLPLPSSSSASAGAASTGASAPAASGTGSSSGGGGGSCPSGFINTVFNTNAGQNGGWPSTTWNSLSSNGVNDWIGFSVGTLDTKSTYGGCATMPTLNEHQIHVVMDPSDTDTAVTMVQGASPPKYLELFNEPDFSFEGFTPLTDAVTAASNLQKLFSIPHPQTTYISPALMDANGPWLPTFRDSCKGCFDQIPIIAMHIYDPTIDGVMSHITNLHNTWPDKKIWITELSPATSSCSMDSSAIAAYMNELFPKIIALGYVEKIFWNSGEWDATAINGAPASCNPALTDASGNATPVLTALKNACGGGGGGTATS